MECEKAIIFLYAANSLRQKKNAFCEAASVNLQYFFKVKKSYVTCKNVAEEFLKNIAR
jgi:hypothetical protein